MITCFSSIWCIHFQVFPGQHSLQWGRWEILQEAGEIRIHTMIVIIMPKPYLWHPNHELDHKFLNARQDITYKSLITEHRFLTRVELNVQKLSEVADLSPTGVLNTALPGIVGIRMYSVYRIVGNFRGQVDLHKHFPHKNVGVAYRNACNEVKRNLYSRKSLFSPHEKITCYTVLHSICIWAWNKACCSYDTP